MKIDLHVHTSYSPDAINGLAGLVRACRDKKIIPAITDHNTMRSFQELRQMKFEFIPGEEVRTDCGDLIGLYISETIAKKTPFLEAVDRIKEQGGLACLPHMYDVTRAGVSREDYAKKADIIEVYNPRCTFETHNEQAMEFARKNNKRMGAGSDAHFVSEIGNGFVETGREFDLSGPKGLLEALDNGKIVRRKQGLERHLIRPATSGVKLAKMLFKF